MVRIVGGRRPSIRFNSGTTVTTSAAVTSLGGGTVSAGSTAPANNVYVSPVNNPGPSIRQLGGTAVVSSVVSPSGIHTVAPASTGVAPASTGSESSSSTNYKLSIASMLLAMKNQALGSLSLGGSKAGGSITKNYSGVNLG